MAEYVERHGHLPADTLATMPALPALPALPKQIVLASGNAKKKAELQRLLSDLSVEILPQSDFGIRDAIEDGLTFVENAIIKARHAAYHAKLPALADDSGLAVHALDGTPGIRSARYAGDKALDADNNAKLLLQLEGVADDARHASFHCALVFLRHADDPVPLICQGVWRGHVLHNLRGEHGFGYDPLFWVPTHHCSAAELDPAEKNRISHRGQAMQQLLRELATSYSC